MARDGQESKKRERQTARDGQENKKQERQPETAVMDSKDGQHMIRLRWEGNKSVRYDGKTQDVEARFIVPEDRNATVGDTVCVKWGRQSRMWKAMVVPVGQGANSKPRKHSATPEPVVQTKKQKRRGETPALMGVHKEGK